MTSTPHHQLSLLTHRSSMTEFTLRNITGLSPEDIEIKKSYYIMYYDADASTLEEALDSVDRGQESFKAFWVAVGPSKKCMDYFRELSSASSKPQDSLSRYDSITRDTPYASLAIALGVESGFLSIKPDTKLFNGCILDEERKEIGPVLTGPSPERIQELSDLYKPFTGEDLPKGDINTVLPFVFNKIRIPIEVQPGEPVVLKGREFLDTLLVHMLGESWDSMDSYSVMKLFDSCNKYSLDPNEWAVLIAVNLADDRLCKEAYEGRHHLRSDRIQPRDVDHPKVIYDICNYFKKSDVSIYPTRLGDLWHNKVFKVVDNHDVDAPVQPGHDSLPTSCKGQTLKRTLTVGGTISGTPTAKRADAQAAVADSTNQEHHSPEYPTASANKPHESATSERNSKPAPETLLAALKEKVDTALRKIVQSMVDAAVEEMIQSKVDDALQKMVQSKVDAALQDDAALQRMVQSKVDALHSKIK